MLKRQRQLQREQLQFRFNGSDVESNRRRKDNNGATEDDLNDIKTHVRYNGHSSYLHDGSRDAPEMSGLRRIDHLLLGGDGMLGSRLIQ